jgi:HPt (histidine-containing phosphotransfer) domain-containing protein
MIVSEISNMMLCRFGRISVMRALKSLLIVVLAAGLIAACGKSQEQIAAEKAAEETKEAAEALKKAAESAGAAGAAQGMNELAKAMEGVAGALGGTTPDGKPVEPVRFQDLQTALPDVAGWQRGEPTGERMTSPVPFSQVEADYTMGDANISVKVVDSGFSQMLIAPWAMFLAAGYERESSEGYEKSVTVDGNPGFERYNKANRDGELNIVFAKRFLVTIEGDNIADTKVLHDFAAKLDASKLESLK